MSSTFANLCQNEIDKADVSDWEINDIELVDDYGEPLSGDEPTGTDFIPDEGKISMEIMQICKYYGWSYKQVHEEMPYHAYVHAGALIKAFEYRYPKRRGQIKPGR